MTGGISSTPDAHRTPPLVAFIANGSEGGAAGERGARIAQALGTRARSTQWFRSGGRIGSAVRIARGVRAQRPDVTYLVDIAAAPLAAWLFAGAPGRLIVDTGDAPRDFIRLVSKNPLKRAAASLLERVGYGRADRIVVRGPFHKKDLVSRGFTDVQVIPDGVDLDLFQERDCDEIRSRLGLNDVFVVGIQGNFTWYPDLGGGLGWEAVSALKFLKDLPVHVVLIGEGPGIPELRSLASQQGVSERLHTIGRVSLESLPTYLSMCDAFLLTQTNDPSSWIRTTGKLPGYLAIGRPILASNVGTASELLPDEMLISYDGEWDLGYPQRLAERIRRLYEDPSRIERGAALIPLSKQFDYDEVARDAADVVLQVAD